MDLIDLLDTAETVLETSGITFGEDTPPEALGAGFSHLEESPGDRSFAWAVGKEAWVYPWLGSRRPRILTITVKPFVAPAISRQSISAEWNSEVLFHAELDLENRWRTFRFGIPEEVQVEGRNNLRFSFVRSDRPIDSFPEDREVQDARSLSVAFDALVLEAKGDFAPGKPVPQSRLEVTESGGNRAVVFVSPGEIRYHLCLPAGSRLRFRYRGTGKEEVPIAVYGTTASGERKELFAGLTSPKNRPWQNAELGLGDANGEAYRLTIACPEGGVELEAPTLLVPPGVVEESLFGISPREESGAQAEVAPRPNILFYLIDALRADHLGCYGYPRPTSPFIDSLADSGVLFAQAFAHNPWTKNSMAAILTGRYPSACGMVGTNDALARDLTTLPELLSEGGYTCFAFSANGYMSPQFGFDQGFDEFVVKKNASPKEPPIPSNVLHEEIFKKLDRIAASQPFFVYVHTVDPHGPYTPVGDFASRFDRGYRGDLTGELSVLEKVHRQYRFLTDEEVSHLIDLYDAEIAFNDAQFRMLLDEIERRGLGENLLVLLTSDHGEEFLDHGNLEHSRALYGESLHVPLIVRWRSAEAGRREEAPVGHVDLVPTLGAIGGATVPEGFAGRSLVELLKRGDPAAPHREAFSELNLESMVSLRRGGSSVLVSEEGRDWRETPMPRVQWFKTDGDPRELRNRAASDPIRAGLDAAAALYYRHRARRQWQLLGTKAEAAQIDEETRRALEALGYMK